MNINMNDTKEVDSDFQPASRCFSNAAMEVISMATGLKIYEIENGFQDKKKYSGKISGMMILYGQKNAVLSLTMSQDTAANLVSYMTGIAPDEIDKEELCDGAAELVNMIAGRAKVKLQSTEYHFSITPPFSIVGEEYSTMYKSKVLRIYKSFAVDDMLINLEVAYI